MKLDVTSSECVYKLSLLTMWLVSTTFIGSYKWFGIFLVIVVTIVLNINTIRNIVR